MTHPMKCWGSAVLASLGLLGCAADAGTEPTLEALQPYDPEEVSEPTALAEATSVASDTNGLINKGAGVDWSCSANGKVGVECTGAFDHCRGDYEVDVRCSGRW